MTFRIRQRVRSLHDDQRGSSLTEFTIFLPIWIVMFIAIINLGRVGIFSTTVQLQAQRTLWDQAVAVSADFGSAEHLTPPGGAGFALAGYTNVAGTDGNDQSGNDYVEAGLTTAGLGLLGHFGESTDKAYLPLYPFLPEGVKDKLLPSDVLEMDDTSRYPHKLLNDTIAEANYSAGSVGDIVAALVSATGFVHSVGAGSRYGSVFADVQDSDTLMAGYGSYSAGAHYDVLVPPRALTGAEAFGVPFGIAFIQFKTDEKYMEYQMFGSENWGGGFGAADTPQQGEWDDQVDNESDDEIDAQCDGICGSWSGDEDPPVPKPANYDKCGC